MKKISKTSPFKTEEEEEEEEEKKKKASRSKRRKETQRRGEKYNRKDKTKRISVSCRFYPAGSVKRRAIKFSFFSEGDRGEAKRRRVASARDKDIRGKPELWPANRPLHSLAVRARLTVAKGPFIAETKTRIVERALAETQPHTRSSTQTEYNERRARERVKGMV